MKSTYSDEIWVRFFKKIQDKIKIGFLNSKESESGFLSFKNRLIQDLSALGALKEPECIVWFL